MKKFSIIALAAAAIAITLTGCQTSNIVGQQPSPEKIKIGVISTMTGVGSYYGQQQTRGLELAQEEINKNGGINGRQIEFVYEDSATDPKTAVSAFQKLIGVDKAKYVIGDSWNTTAAALAPVASEQKVILISPVASLNSLSLDDMFFRTVPSVDYLMKPLAEYAYNDLKSKKIGALVQKTPFGTEHLDSFKKYFNKLGGQIVAEEGFDLTSKDVRAEISKVKAKRPDTILNLHAAGPMLGLLMKQAKELGVKAKWITSYGAENANLIKEYKTEVEGLIYPYFYSTDDNSTSSRDFVSAYKQKHNELPDFTAAGAYDALKILALAISRAGDDPLAVKQELLKIKDYDGASGKLSFDKNGDVQKNIIIKQIKNGAFIKIK